jgi:O-antigen ligase
LLGAGIVLACRRESSPALRWTVAVLVLLTAAGGLYMSWSSLGRRLAETAHDPLSGRRETYELAQQMARDYPWFGTGPGTFDPLFQMYRQNPEQYWPAQLHNDWLELRITYGRLGFGLILCALAVACLRWLLAGGVTREPSFLLILTMTLGGCLLHARYDFPFQIYSLQFLFLLLAAILFSSSRGSRTGKVTRAPAG